MRRASQRDVLSVKYCHYYRSDYRDIPCILITITIILYTITKKTNGKRIVAEREVLDRGGGGGSLRQESHRLSANVRAFLLGPKIRRDENEMGARRERKLGQARSPARARERERRKLVARERARKEK